MQTTKNPQDLQFVIEQLLARREEIKNSRTIKEVVEDSFNKRWDLIVQNKNSEFVENLTKMRQIVRLEIAIVESISDFIPVEFSEEIKLGFVKVRKSNNLQNMNGIYRKYRDDVKLRQVIKLINSVYRYNRLTFENDRTPQYYVTRTDLKSRIKYATNCEHCGEIAKQILHNMQQSRAVDLP